MRLLIFAQSRYIDQTGHNTVGMQRRQNLDL